jgi:hypothetical protein
MLPNVTCEVEMDFRDAAVLAARVLLMLLFVTTGCWARRSRSPPLSVTPIGACIAGGLLLLAIATFPPAWRQSDALDGKSPGDRASAQERSETPCPRASRAALLRISIGRFVAFVSGRGRAYRRDVVASGNAR